MGRRARLLMRRCRCAAAGAGRPEASARTGPGRDVARAWRQDTAATPVGADGRAVAACVRHLSLTYRTRHLRRRPGAYGQCPARRGTVAVGSAAHSTWVHATDLRD